MGDIHVRDRVTPILNMDATTLIGLIDWDMDTIHEPVLAASLLRQRFSRVLGQRLEWTKVRMDDNPKGFGQ